MSQGTITHLIATGHVDRYLTERPEISFWRYKHQRYTQFACEGVNVPFSTNSNISAGGQSSVVLPRQGDMLAKCYVVVELPGIANVTTATQAPQTTAGYETKNAANTDSTVAYAEVVEETLHDTYMALCSNKGHASSELTAKHTTADSDSTTGEGVPYWSDGVGYVLCKEAKIQLGGATIDTCFSEMMFMQEELSHKPGKGCTEMVGKSGKEATVADLKARSKKYQRLFVPLPFFFTKHSGSALSLVSLQFHDVTIRCTWRGVKDLVVNGSGLGKGTTYIDNGAGATVATQTVVRAEETTENATTLGALSVWTTSGTAGTAGQTTSGTLLADTHVKVSLEVKYCYLSRDERKDLAESSFETLITTNQTSTQISSSASSIISKLNFNHAVTELIFGVRQKYFENLNQWTNFGGLVDPLTARQQDAVRTVSLKLNNHDRFASAKGAAYFRTVVPYEAHNSIPEGFTYCYSFAHSADSVMPSGSCNFSRIDSAELTLTVDPALYTDNSTVGGKTMTTAVSGGNSITVFCFARSHNVLRISLGVSGLAFSN
jgi:hypothetical protein